MTNKQEFMERWFERLWTEEDPEAIDDMWDSAYKAVGLGPRYVFGPEDFKQFQGAMCNLMSEIDVTVDKCLEEGDWASVYCTLRAKSRVNNGAVVLPGNVLVRIENGKIQEGYNHFDFLSLWEQLGLIPDDSFEKGLQGGRVA